MEKSLSLAWQIGWNRFSPPNLESKGFLAAGAGGERNKNGVLLAVCTLLCCKRKRIIFYVFFNVVQW
jgi:hypothetical protein